jgi:hypothetical protein
MKVLISSIGSRGDVQPILALELRAGGHNVSLCVAPNFKDWRGFWAPRTASNCKGRKLPLRDWLMNSAEKGKQN